MFSDVCFIMPMVAAWSVMKLTGIVLELISLPSFRHAHATAATSASVEAYLFSTEEVSLDRKRIGRMSSWKMSLPGMLVPSHGTWSWKT